MAVTDLISGSNARLNIAFGVACGCCFIGFVTAIVMYAYYGFFLHQDMTAGLQVLTYVFIGQGFSGMIASLFNRTTTPTATV
jgi:hypothetical protein